MAFGRVVTATAKRVFEDWSWILVAAVTSCRTLDHIRDILNGNALWKGLFFVRVVYEFLNEFVLGRSMLDTVERVSSASGGRRVRTVLVH